MCRRQASPLSHEAGKVPVERLQMNYLQWIAASGIFLFAYTLGWVNGRECGRVEGVIQGRKTLRRELQNNAR